MKLDDMLALQPGWDSYDALPISARTIERAKEILTHLPGNWKCVPVADGGVQLEQETGGNIVEIYIHGS